MIRFNWSTNILSSHTRTPIQIVCGIFGSPPAQKRHDTRSISIASSSNNSTARKTGNVNVIFIDGFTVVRQLKSNAAPLAHIQTSNTYLFVICISIFFVFRFIPFHSFSSMFSYFHHLQFCGAHRSYTLHSCIDYFSRFSALSSQWFCRRKNRKKN